MGYLVEMHVRQCNTQIMCVLCECFCVKGPSRKIAARNVLKNQVDIVIVVKVPIHLHDVGMLKASLIRYLIEQIHLAFICLEDTPGNNF